MRCGYECGLEPHVHDRVPVSNGCSDEMSCLSLPSVHGQSTSRRHVLVHSEPSARVVWLIFYYSSQCNVAHHSRIGRKNKELEKERERQTLHNGIVHIVSRHSTAFKVIGRIRCPRTPAAGQWQKSRFSLLPHKGRVCVVRQCRLVVWR